MLVLPFIACMIFFSPSIASDLEISDEERAWLEADEDTSQVSEGELRFLTNATGEETLHIRNQITILPTSLIDGWVALKQCHHNLTPLPELQITYRYRAIRNLAIASSDGIGRAWISEQSVQMENIEKSASICIVAEVQIMRRSDDDHYLINNGPFHLRFLDGYYPLRLTLAISYPENSLITTGVTPEPQPGVTVEEEPGKIVLDTRFEGMLYTEFRFRLKE